MYLFIVKDIGLKLESFMKKLRFYFGCILIYNKDNLFFMVGEVLLF